MQLKLLTYLHLFQLALKLINPSMRMNQQVITLLLTEFARLTHRDSLRLQSLYLPQKLTPGSLLLLCVRPENIGVDQSLLKPLVFLHDGSLLLNHFLEAGAKCLQVLKQLVLLGVIDECFNLSQSLSTILDPSLGLTDYLWLLLIDVSHLLPLGFLVIAALFVQSLYQRVLVLVELQYSLSSSFDCVWNILSGAFFNSSKLGLKSYSNKYSLKLQINNTSRKKTASYYCNNNM